MAKRTLELMKRSFRSILLAMQEFPEHIVGLETGLNAWESQLSRPRGQDQTPRGQDQTVHKSRSTFRSAERMPTSEGSVSAAPWHWRDRRAIKELPLRPPQNTEAAKAVGEDIVIDKPRSEASKSLGRSRSSGRDKSSSSVAKHRAEQPQAARRSSERSRSERTRKRKDTASAPMPPTDSGV